MPKLDSNILTYFQSSQIYLVFINEGNTISCFWWSQVMWISILKQLAVYALKNFEKDLIQLYFVTNFLNIGILIYFSFSTNTMRIHLAKNLLHCLVNFLFSYKRSSIQLCSKIYPFKLTKSVWRLSWSPRFKCCKSSRANSELNIWND